MRLFKVVVRFNDSTDFVQHFSSDLESSNYFFHLVKFELDGLISSVVSITLLHGKKVLRHYNNFLNVKH